MMKCCKPEGKPKRLKTECPMCARSSLNVQLKTMLHHVKQAWMFKITDQQYFYCRNPKCDVVYFAADATPIKQSDIRTLIGIKEQSEYALICFCFGVSKKQAATNNKVKDFVIKQTKELRCSCETANPSGRCCLKDFPKNNKL